MQALTSEEILQRLESMEGWEYADNALHTTLQFETFKDTFSVMTRIAFEAEKMNHHPDWTNVYNTLHIRLSTHDADGVTEYDFQMASIIDELIQ